MNIIDRFKIDNLLIYFTSYILLWEWIKPLETITDTGYSDTFMIFIGVCLFLFMVRCPWFISLFTNCLIILYFLHDIFFVETLYSSEWFVLFVKDVIINIKLLVFQDWYSMSNLFRTFLFFILLWILCYLIHFWLERTKRIFVFFLLTIIYIALIDTFLPFDGKWSMVQTVGAGFFLIAFTNMRKVIKNEGIDTKLLKWLLSLILFISTSFMVGFLFPKLDPQWADPVPYFKSTATKYQQSLSGQGAGVSKIGYGTNDEHLGGPFIGDDTAVFQVEISNVHYWRVETKDFYTGKGWVTSVNEDYIQLVPNEINQNAYSELVETTGADAAIMSLDNSGPKHFIYSPDLQEINAGAPIEVFLNSGTEKILLSYPAETEDIYSIQYEHPTFSVDLLEQSVGNDEEGMRERYTQLPQELPQRIYDLADSLIVGKENRYEKVRAIESHLTSGAYIYETQDVAIPEKSQDYVDQFLFETKKGYCDNFSSAMVVLLRSAGIPARWVKGYTQGKYLDTIDEGVRKYEIRNDNAHSWVEVYFSGIGWVPFEPTRGYTNPYHFATEQENELDTPRPEIEELEKDEEKKEPVEQAKVFSITNWFNFNVISKGIILVVATIGCISLVAFITRKKWLAKFFIYRMRRLDKQQAFSKAYNILLKLMDKKIQKRKPSQTLGEYAKEVDQILGTSDMEMLTGNFERYIYANLDGRQAWDKSEKLWENLIKEIWS